MRLLPKILFFHALAIFLALATFASTARAEYVARHGLTPTQYQAAFDEYAKAGFRLKSVSGYVTGGAEHYAALWTKVSGPEWTARHGLSAAQYQQAFDDLARQGFRLTWISGHEAGGAVKYAAIWEKKTGPAWAGRHGLNGAQYQAAFDDLVTKQGYRLLHVNGTSVGGAASYAAIFEKSPGPVWIARHGLSASQYQTEFTQHTGQGYRLKEVSGYHVGGGDQYAAIWEKVASPVWSARHGIPDAWYQNVFDNFAYQGYEPTLITAFTSGGAGKLNGIWDNAHFSGADLGFISSQMKSYMATNSVPGASLAITKDGRLVYAAGFGQANTDTGEEAGPTSQYRIASVSKNITTAAIMKLVEAGKLGLGDKVFGPGGRLSAQFPTPASNTKINQITIKHLLEHVSGLSNAGGDPMFMNTSMNHAQLISWMLNDSAHKMTRNANTQFEYLNFGYCLLGRVIEAISGKTYETFVKDNVLAPAGVHDMAIAANTAAGKRPREVAYYPADSYTLNVSRFDSHGGWVASPIDLVRYVVRVDGLATKPDILSLASWKTMLTDSGIKDSKGNDPNYGFGWGLPQWHNGDIEGTIAFLQVLPGGYTYAVLANTRPSGDSGAFNLSAVVQKIISGVSKWPAYDQF